MKLLRAFSRQIEGEYAFDQVGDAGTRFVLSFPVTFEEQSDAATELGSDIALNSAINST